MDERHLEVKVGALVLAAVAGALGLLWLMGELSGFGGAELAVELAHTGNVVRGAPVKLGGVSVGRVDRIVLTPSRRDDRGEPLPVRMELSLSNDALAALRTDATISVSTQGPLGEAYFELSPGSASAGPLPAGSVLRGIDAVRLEQVAQRLSRMLDSTSRMLQDNPQALAALVGNVSDLTHTVDQVLSDNRAEIQGLVTELSAAAKDLRLLSATARKTLEPGGRGAALIDGAADAAQMLNKEVPPLSANATRALAGLSALSSGFTPEDGKHLKAALERYAAAGEKLDQIAARADRLLARIEAGEGTLGGLQKDPKVYEDLKALIADLRAHPWKVLWKN
jgi:phospholipid/cholesterol/gamma-HCH transport system substrate-binding protein